MTRVLRTAIIGLLTFSTAHNAAAASDQDWPPPPATLNGVTINIRVCDPSPASHAPTATCSVKPGFVLVGGGAEVVNSQPQALLTGSFPDLALTTWTAKSKDHDFSFVHQIRAFAIGLKLAGVSEGSLRANMSVRSEPSPLSEMPTHTTVVPTGMKLIGGGARSNWSSAGLLLTHSYPLNDGWSASAKDHVFVEFGTVDVFAIGINKFIPGFGWITASALAPSPFNCPGGFCATSVTHPTNSDSLVTSIGGYAEHDHASFHPGRLLVSLTPYTQVGPFVVPGISMLTKDHHFPDSGINVPLYIMFKKCPNQSFPDQAHGCP